MEIWGTYAYARVVIGKNEKVHGHVNLNAGRKFLLRRLTLSALFPLGRSLSRFYAMSAARNTHTNPLKFV